MCIQLKGRETLLKKVAAEHEITGNICMYMYGVLPFPSVVGEIYNEMFSSFCKLLQNPAEYVDNVALSNTVENIHTGSTHIDSLFTHFINHAHKCYPLLYVLPQLRSIADLTSPAQW